MFNWEKHFSRVDGDDGFSTDELSDKDLKLFRAVLFNHYTKVISENYPEISYISTMENYHLISEELDHSDLWALKTFKTGNRVLNKQSMDKLLESDFFSSLNEYYCASPVNVCQSNSQLQFAQTVMFRLVRPSPFKDVGDLHSDKWFWDLSTDSIPSGYRRLKFWISLYNDDIKTGFRLVRGSHNSNYSYESRKNEFGQIKPVFDEKRYNLKVDSFKSNSGGFVIFHDNLLHGGETVGRKTRVSCEFTILVK